MHGAVPRATDCNYVRALIRDARHDAVVLGWRGDRASLTPHRAGRIDGMPNHLSTEGPASAHAAIVATFARLITHAPSRQRGEQQERSHGR